MKKEGKKYVIKESELKEIVQEMLLMEFFGQSVSKDMYTTSYRNNAQNTGVVPKSSNGNGNIDFKKYLELLFGDVFNKSFGQTQVVNNGKNADASQPLNVAAACNWLKQHAKASSIGYCARYIRQALNAGGLGVPHGMPAPDAKSYQRILPSNGWDEIPMSQAGQAGDVMVIGQYEGRPHGHIAMCIGNGRWASDFIQKTMYGLRVPPPPEFVHFYRYRNKA